MQKKLLASLLVTPLAFNALADIKIDKFGETWTPDGLVGQEGFTVNGNVVTCAVGSGQLVQKLTLPIGNYQLSFGTTENLNVRVDGASNLQNAGNDYSFSVLANGEVTITIEAKTANYGFSFSDAQLNLVFDFATSNAQLSAKLQAVMAGLEQVNADDQSADAKVLRDLYKAYTDKAKAIEDLIATVKDGMTLDDFGKLNLGKYPDGDNIDNDINALAEQIKNDNYTVRLNAYNAYVANMAKYQVVADDLNALQTKMSKLNADKNTALAGLPENQVEFVNGHDDSSLAEAAVAAYAGAVSDYLAKINEAYKNLEDEVFEFEPEDPNVAADAAATVNAYDSELRGALADVEAYNNWKATIDSDEMKKYLTEQINTVVSAPVVKGYEDLLADIMTKTQMDVEKVYSDLQELYNKCALEDAAETLTSDKIETAKTQMKQIADDFVTKVKANNTVLEADIEIINAAQDEINKLPEASSATLVVSMRTTLQNQLNNVKSQMETEYSKLQLTPTNPDVEAVKNSIAASVANLVQIADIQNEFNEAKTYVDKQIAEISSEAPFVKFNDNFKNTFENIQDAINALNENNLDVTGIKTAIENAKKLADQILDEATKVDTQLKAYAALDKAIDDAIVLEGEGATINKDKFKTSAVYTTVKNAYDTYLKLRNDAAGLQNQECFTKLNEAYTDMTTVDTNGNDFAGQVNRAIETFKTNVELSNTIVINKLQDKIDSSITGAEDFNNANSWEPAKTFYADMLAGYKTEADNLKEASKKVANGTADKDVTILTVYNDMKVLLDKVQHVTGNIQANQAAYNDQLNISEAARNNVQGVIDYLDGKIADNNIPDTDTVQKWQDALQQLLVDITKANRVIVEKYGKGESSTFTVEFEDKYTEPINKKANELREEIANKFGDLVAAVNSQWLLQWAGKYSNLRGLLKASIEKYNWYVNVNVSNADFLKDIQDNIAESNEVLYKYNALITELNTNVTAAINGQTTAEVVVTPAMYASYIADYQVYVDAINQAVLTMENNALQGVNDYYTDTLRDLTNRLNGFEAGMKAAFFADNEAFIAGQLAPYRADLQGAENAKAVINTPTAFTGSVTNMTTTQYEAFLDYVNEIHEYVSAINGIANDYFQPVQDLQENTLVVNSWKWAYDGYATSGNTKSAKSLLNGYTVTVNGVITDSKEGLIADVEKYMKAGVTNKTDYDNFCAVVNLINSLNLDGTETLAQLKDLMQSLLAYELDAERYANILKGEWETITGDKFNQQAVDTAISTEEKSFDVLKSVAYGTDNLDGIAGAGYASFVAYFEYVETKLKEIRADFAGVTVWSNDVKADYMSRIANVRTYLKQAYTLLLAGESEIVGLGNPTQPESIIFNIKVAFNNLVQSGYYEGEALEAMNKKIDDLVAAFVSLNASYTPLDAANAEDYKAAAKGYEAQLTDLLNELQSYDSNVKETYADKANAAFDADYKAAEGSVNVALANLAENYPLVYDNYTEKIEKLLAELESYKAQWTASGTLVIAYVDYYIELISHVEADLNTILRDAQKANDIAEAQAALQAASEARYKALTGEITTITTDCGKLAETILSYNIGIYFSNRVNDILVQIQTLSKTIDDDYDANGISESEKAAFTQQIAALNVKVTALAETAAKEFANTSYAAVENAYSVAENTLYNYGIDMVNRTEMQQKLQAEYNKFWAAYIVWRDVTDNGNIADIDANEEFGKTATSIKIAINALLEEAKENTYTPGDLNDAPDGKVDITDVQILIDWVGQGLTQEDLTPAQWAAADINDNGTLNISDVVALINMVFHNDDNAAVRKVMARNVVADNSTIAPVLIEENGDVRKYAVMLNNYVDFIGGQIDFNISAGAEIVGVTAADRAMNHDVNVFDNGSYTRVLLTSLDNQVIAGNEGALLIVEVKNGKLYTENAVFADNNTVAHELTSADPTFIDQIYEAGKSMKEAIYNTAGQMMKKMQRGINIIRNSDGSVTKKMGK